METMGEKIKLLRKGLKLSQTELAERLNVSQDTVSLWENNKSKPDADTIIKLCKIFDTSADYLLGLTEF